MNSFNKSFQKVLLLVSLLCAIVILIGGFLILRQFDFFRTASTNVSDVIDVPRSDGELDGIEQVPDDLIYTLPRGATTLQLDLFQELYHTHDQFNRTGSEEDLINYASVIAQNFIADFFTLSNKSARTDIGGIQFIFDDILDAFYEYALNTFYLHLNHHINTFGSESLPTVETIRVLAAEAGFYSLSLQDYPWTEYIPIIIIDLEWEYQSTTLPYIGEFQTSVRVHLQEINGEVRIIGIVEIPEQIEYQ